jgi:hypothetical protein
MTALHTLPLSYAKKMPDPKAEDFVGESEFSRHVQTGKADNHPVDVGCDVQQEEKRH